MDLELLKQTLKKAGVSETRERTQLFMLLRESDRPLLMSEILSSPALIMNRSTIYRTIELFEKLGIVHTVANGWKHAYELGELFKPHHHHFTCTNCHQTFAVDEPDFIHSWLSNLQNEQGFVVSHHQLEVTGVCKNCQ